MIDNVLKHYKYVKTYDQSQDVPQSIIDELLQRTWKVTPSKNNFMPYKATTRMSNFMMDKKVIIDVDSQ